MGLTVNIIMITTIIDIVIIIIYIIIINIVTLIIIIRYLQSRITWNVGLVHRRRLITINTGRPPNVQREQEDRGVTASTLLNVCAAG